MKYDSFFKNVYYLHSLTEDHTHMGLFCHNQWRTVKKRAISRFKTIIFMDFSHKTLMIHSHNDHEYKHYQTIIKKRTIQREKD